MNCISRGTEDKCFLVPIKRSSHVNLWFQQKPNNSQSICEKDEGKNPQKLQDVVWNDRKQEMTHLTGHKNSITGQVKIWTAYQPSFRRGLLVMSSYWNKGMKSGVYGIPDTEYLLFIVISWHFYLHHLFHIFPVGKFDWDQFLAWADFRNYHSMHKQTKNMFLL